MHAWHATPSYLDRLDRSSDRSKSRKVMPLYSTVQYSTVQYSTVHAADMSLLTMIID